MIHFHEWARAGGLCSLTLCGLRGYPKAANRRCAGRGAPQAAPVRQPAGARGHPHRPGYQCRIMATSPELDPAKHAAQHFVNSSRPGEGSGIAVTADPTLPSRVGGGSDPPPIRTGQAPARSLRGREVEEQRVTTGPHAYPLGALCPGRLPGERSPLGAGFWGSLSDPDLASGRARRSQHRRSHCRIR